MEKVDLKDIVVRKANIDDDLERIAELIYCVDPYIYTYWFDNLDNYKNVIYTINNYVYPMIKFIKEKNIATITNMCVKQEYRNMHIGYKLLKTVIDDFVNKNNGVKYIQFDVLADNASALNCIKI